MKFDLIQDFDVVKDKGLAHATLSSIVKGMTHSAALEYLWDDFSVWCGCHRIRMENKAILVERETAKAKATIDELERDMSAFDEDEEDGVSDCLFLQDVSRTSGSWRA